MPANVLTLPRAVIAPEAAHALPARPPPAEAAGPPASADAALLERPTRAAVEGHEGTDEYGYHGTQPPTSDHGRPQLPGGVRTAEGREDVGGHGVEPIVVGHDVVVRSHPGRSAVHDVVPGRGAGRRGREGVLGAAGLAVQAVARAGVARPAPPLLDAEVVHERHRAGAIAGGEEGIVGGGVVQHDRGEVGEVARQ